jgi:hypothetical protein
VSGLYCLVFDQLPLIVRGVVMALSVRMRIAALRLNDGGQRQPLALAGEEA